MSQMSHLFARLDTASPSHSQPECRNTGRRATLNSISSTLSMLEERETEIGKRCAVYVADEGLHPWTWSDYTERRRSRSAVLPRMADEFGITSHAIDFNPPEKQRPTLRSITTTHSAPHLRNLAELATKPSPSLTPNPGVVSSLISDTIPSTEYGVFSLGKGVSCSPLERAAEEETEAALESPWLLDSLASHSRNGHVSAYTSSASLSTKATKRVALPSRSLDRPRADCDRTPSFMVNVPGRSSDDIHTAQSPSRRVIPAFPQGALIHTVSSSSSAGASVNSTFATPIDWISRFPLPDMDSLSADSRLYSFEEKLVITANPTFSEDSILPSPPPATLILQTPPRPRSPNFMPLQPTLPPPSPDTPSPSILVPTQHSQSFFALIKRRGGQRHKKLVISGPTLEHDIRHTQSLPELNEAAAHRTAERELRVKNIIRWCESFGRIQKVDEKENGSLHIYWKKRQVADTVSR